jgi:hypothetical protein
MSPKEKAKEILSRSYDIQLFNNNEEPTKESIEQVALFVVEEILEELKNETNILGVATRSLYWQEVKNEIEKL